MQTLRNRTHRGPERFFRLIMRFGDLIELYRTDFLVTLNYPFATLSELGNMVPFERDIYVALLLQRIEKMKTK